MKSISHLYPLRCSLYISKVPGVSSTNLANQTPFRLRGLDAWAERAKERAKCSDVESIQVPFRGAGTVGTSATNQTWELHPHVSY